MEMMRRTGRRPSLAPWQWFSSLYKILSSAQVRERWARKEGGGVNARSWRRRVGSRDAAALRLGGQAAARAAVGGQETAGRRPAGGISRRSEASAAASMARDGGFFFFFTWRDGGFDR